MSALLPPALMLAALLIVAYASLFHLWTGRSLADLPIFLIAATFGFIAGQILGGLIQSPWLQIGRLHVLEASAGAWLTMIIVRIVSRIDQVDSRNERS